MRGLPTSDSERKNYPQISFQVVYLSSKIVSFFTPERTIFFAISIPNPDSPINRIFELAYFFKASIPITPIFLLHRSRTSSLSKFNSF